MGRSKPPIPVVSEAVGLDLPVLPPKKPNRPKVPKSTRLKVLERDDYTCRYCGSMKQLTMDHVIPLSKGGKNRLSNIVTACQGCNNQKADKDMKPGPPRSKKRT